MVLFLEFALAPSFARPVFVLFRTTIVEVFLRMKGKFPLSVVSKSSPSVETGSEFYLLFD